MMCQKCEKTLPDDTISQMNVNGEYRKVCAICALEIRNTEMGIPKEEPFNGPIAHQMFLNAVKYLEQTNQDYPAWAKRIKDAN